MRSGSCQCGQVSYELSEPEIGLIVCYCTECQKMSTGIATYGMVVPRSALRIVTGRLSKWERFAASGARAVCHFCPECGVRIFHENPEEDIVRLKAGHLDDASQLVPDAHLWTRSAPGWVTFPDGCLAYETQDSPKEMIAAIKKRRENAAP